MLQCFYVSLAVGTINSIHRLFLLMDFLFIFVVCITQLGISLVTKERFRKKIFFFQFFHGSLKIADTTFQRKFLFNRF